MMRAVKLFALLATVLVTVAGCNHAPTRISEDPVLVSEDYFVESADGLQIFVRNKRLVRQASFNADKTLLFVHGATYPASAMFDLQLDGQSWMDYIASRGYDVYLMDLPGFGRSESPAELSQPADTNEPVVKTAQAIEEFGRVVEDILARRGLDQINVMGWSWGTTIVAGYTAENVDKVNKLVLVAPIWLPRETREDAFGELGAWRAVTEEEAWNRWVGGIPEARREQTIPRAWFEAWWRENMVAAPRGAEEDPQVMIAPNGTLYDIELWLSGTALYDPARITVPVLLAVAEWDTDTPISMAVDLFAELMNAPVKRSVLVGGGTHTVLMERNREQLFREVQLFLDE